MKEFQYTITDPEGIHARPAGELVKAAKAFTSSIKIVKDGKEEIKTGLKKFGAMLGDYMEVGCNSVLNPGTVIGAHTNVYPLSMVRGVVADHSIYKNRNEVVQKNE